MSVTANALFSDRKKMKHNMPDNKKKLATTLKTRYERVIPAK
jgi:hypothetical protein